MKYIDAEKLKKTVEQAKQRALKGAEVDKDLYCDGRADAFGQVLLEINSLQQEQPSEDLEKEIEKWFDMMGESWENGEWSTNDIRSTARHFYELGLNARKED